MRSCRFFYCDRSMSCQPLTVGVHPSFCCRFQFHRLFSARSEKDSCWKAFFYQAVVLNFHKRFPCFLSAGCALRAFRGSDSQERNGSTTLFHACSFFFPPVRSSLVVVSFLSFFSLSPLCDISLFSEKFSHSSVLPRLPAYPS